MITLSRFKSLALAGLLSLSVSQAAIAADLTVGSKNFTEQLLVAQMTTQILEKMGHKVKQADGMGTNIVRAALENGQVDVYWEYTGTSLINFNKITERMSPEATYNKVKELDAGKGLVWLAPSKANNTYALAVRKQNPKTDAIRTLSDLAAAYKAGKPIVMAATAEFPRREDGLLGMEKTYGFEAGRANVRPMDGGLVYAALQNGDVDIAVVAATDGRIAAMELRLLRDDKQTFPHYALAPVVRKVILDANPAIRGALEALSAKLDDATMQRLNGEVDVKKVPIKDVATKFLREQGLL